MIYLYMPRKLIIVKHQMIIRKIVNKTAVLKVAISISFLECYFIISAIQKSLNKLFVL